MDTEPKAPTDAQIRAWLRTAMQHPGQGGTQYQPAFVEFAVRHRKWIIARLRPETLQKLDSILKGE